MEVCYGWYTTDWVQNVPKLTSEVESKPPVLHVRTIAEVTNPPEYQTNHTNNVGSTLGRQP